MKAFACNGFRNQLGGKYWLFWFRIFGYGLAVSNLIPCFSERHGFIKVTRIFGIRFQVLKPTTLETQKGKADVAAAIGIDVNELIERSVRRAMNGSSKYKPHQGAKELARRLKQAKRQEKLK